MVKDSICIILNLLLDFSTRSLVWDTFPVSTFECVQWGMNTYDKPSYLLLIPFHEMKEVQDLLRPEP